MNQKNDNLYISVAYKLYVHDEEDTEETLHEEVSAERPFIFISGLECVLSAFEEKLCALAKGAHFDFVIPVAEAYGEVDDDKILDVPREALSVDGKLDEKVVYEGNVIPLRDEDGCLYHATVLEVKSDAVTIDLNHPLAGETLHFVGEVLENRTASNDELTMMVRMLAGEGCGGHCGGCGGNCEGGDCDNGGCNGGCCHS